MIRNEVHVLFCDNEPGRHELFLRFVLPSLKKAFPTYNVLAHHSQSLGPEYEANYDSTLKAKNAKSVWTFLADRQDWDLIISDIDFEKKYRMGSPRTGVDILRVIDSKRLIWTEAILITRYSDEQTHDLYDEIGGLMSGRHSVINLSLSDPEQNWRNIASKATEHLADALAVREKRKEFPNLSRMP